MSTLLAARRQRVSAEARPGLTLAAALVGFFMITLDAVVVVNIALPSIRRDLLR
jgi:MFS transporter, DHA2 family, methylenomycin A resistance protein